MNIKMNEPHGIAIHDTIYIVQIKYMTYIRCHALQEESY